MFAPKKRKEKLITLQKPKNQASFLHGVSKWMQKRRAELRLRKGEKEMEEVGKEFRARTIARYKSHVSLVGRGQSKYERKVVGGKAFLWTWCTYDPFGKRKECTRSVQNMESRQGRSSASVIVKMLVVRNSDGNRGAEGGRAVVVRRATELTDSKGRLLPLVSRIESENTSTLPWSGAGTLTSFSARGGST